MRQYFVIRHGIMYDHLDIYVSNLVSYGMETWQKSFTNPNEFLT